MPALAVASSAETARRYGPVTRIPATRVAAPHSADSSTDWLNTRFACAWSLAPAACATSATVPTPSICVRARITNPAVPALLTPAMAASPRRETKYRSTRKYKVWNSMPIAIGTASPISSRVMEPWVRSFIVVRSLARSFVTRDLGPLAPLPGDGFAHALRGLGKPRGPAGAEIPQDGAPLPRSSQVHVGRLPAHHPQQPPFIVATRQALERDAAAVRRQAPDEPRAVHRKTRIRNPHGAPDQLGVARGARHAGLARPLPGRRCERLRLPRDHPAAPLGQPDQSQPSQAPEPGLALDEAHFQAALGHRRLQQAAHGRWHATGGAAQAAHVVPVRTLVLQAHDGKIAQPAVALGEHRRAATLAQRLRVALQDGLTGAAAGECQSRFLDRHQGARAEAHQVLRIRQRRGFVEIVHTPDQASLGVAPGGEVLPVQGADAQRAGCRGRLAADLWPQLRPAVEGGAQEREHVLRHEPVLQIKVALQNRHALHEPALVGAGGFPDVHEPHLKGGPEPLPPIRRRPRLRPR